MPRKKPKQPRSAEPAAELMEYTPERLLEIVMTSTPDEWRQAAVDAGILDAAGNELPRFRAWGKKGWISRTSVPACIADSEIPPRPKRVPRASKSNSAAASA